MSSQDSRPWWEQVNKYLSFDERNEFVRGATNLRPNNSFEVLMGMLKAGYVNDKFEKPQSHTGKQK